MTVGMSAELRPTSRADQTALIYCPQHAVRAVSARSLLLAVVVAVCVPFARGQSEDDPLQDGQPIPGAQPQGEFLGGAFGVSQSGEVQGFFIPIKRRTQAGKGLADEIKFHDQRGDRGLEEAVISTSTRKGYVKSRGGRFVAIVSRDRVKKVSSTDIYDLNGNRIGRLPQHVVALSGNARFAALRGYTQVAEVPSGKTIDLAIPGDAAGPELQLSEDSDAFTSSYRRGKDLYVAAFANDGKLKWRKAVATGNEPSVRNTLFSPSGDRVAVVAGELPIDHLTLYDSAGQAVWTKEISPGNYALSFTPDGAKLLLIHRDGHVLFNVADGLILWEKPFPLANIAKSGTLLATKILISGKKFIVASRSALSTDPGKKPHETTNRISGPDLIYTVDEDGRFKLLMNRPSGTFLTEGGRFHYEPIVTLGGEPPKVYYLTERGLRRKNLR